LRRADPAGLCALRRKAWGGTLSAGGSGIGGGTAGQTDAGDAALCAAAAGLLAPAALGAWRARALSGALSGQVGVGEAALLRARGGSRCPGPALPGPSRHDPGVDGIFLLRAAGQRSAVMWLVPGEDLLADRPGTLLLPSQRQLAMGPGA